jgi:hypothetical protein
MAPCRTPNAWILFSNDYYKELRRSRRIKKRQEAMKIAQVKWSKMTGEKKRPWFRLAHERKHQLSMSDDPSDPFIFDLSWIDSKKKTEDDICWELFYQFVNQDMLE